MRCKNCGYQIKSPSDYCPKCGSPLSRRAISEIQESNGGYEHKPKMAIVSLIGAIMTLFSIIGTLFFVVYNSNGADFPNWMMITMVIGGIMIGVGKTATNDK